MAETQQIITDLRALLIQHLQDWHTPWPGANFGKTIIGNSLLGALERHGCNPGEELLRALHEAGWRQTEQGAWVRGGRGRGPRA